jgi:broad specificity phosphatase PhoE
VVLWRHGQTAWNLAGRFQGQTDVDLDETGREQATRAGRMLAALSPVVVVSSDLRRAADTAAALAAVTAVEVTYDQGLRETYAGVWEGLERVELRQRHGDELAAWARGEDVRPGGGESRSEVAKRSVAAVERALLGVPERGTLVVVTHGGAARVAIGQMLGLSQELWGTLGPLANCSWSVLGEGDEMARTDGAWRLLEHNAGSLPEPVLGDDR